MSAKDTLKRYIEACDNVLTQNDNINAKKLEKEIVSVFGKEIDEIRQGLSQYSFGAYYSALNGTASTNYKVNHIEDIKLLRSKLQMELEKIDLDLYDNTTSTILNNKIFISHSSSDVQFVQAFVNLLEDIGLSEDDIFCSSIPGYGIPLGQDIYDWLLNQFKNFNLHVMFVLSQNYYKSIACLNEMGAAWVLKQKYDTILLPDFDFQEIKGAINPNQIGIKLDCEEGELKHRLNELKDTLIEEFHLKPISLSKWERHRDEFLNTIKVIPQTVADDNVTDEADKKNNSISKEAAVLLAYATDESSPEIVKINSIVGLSVSAGKWNFIGENANPREESRWIDAISELENYGLIKDKGYEGELFRVTTNGYKVADEVKVKLSIDINNPPSNYLE